MRTLNVLLLSVTLGINSTAWSTPFSSDTVTNDSLKIYHIVFYKMWGLIKIAQNAAICDTLVAYQAKEISKGLKAQASSDSLLDVRTQELENSKSQGKEKDALYDNQVALTGEEKKQKHKFFWWAVGATILAVANFLH